MNVLAVDTSTDACSVALQTDDGIDERHVVAAREHTRLLMPMIEELLESHGLAVAGLDTIVLGNGPGSFVGMRIAASVVQGIAFAAGLKIVPVSSLSAVAGEWMATESANRVAVAQDARMGDVYLAEFVARRGIATAVQDPVLHRVGDPLPEAIDADCVLAGAGWHQHPELQAAAKARGLAIADIQLPRAQFLLPAGLDAWRENRAIAPQDLEPAYVRMQVASVPGSPSV